MASYTTLVELVNPDASDFDLLHQEMRDKQFYRALSYCGTWHDMPDAEYDRTTNLAMVDLYNDGIAAAQAVINNKPISDKQQKKDFYILVTNADGPRTLILPKPPNWLNYRRERCFNQPGTHCDLLSNASQCCLCYNNSLNKC